MVDKAKIVEQVAQEVDWAGIAPTKKGAAVDITETILTKARYFDLLVERDRLQREANLWGSVTVWLGCRKCGTEWSMTVGLPFSFNDYECPECKKESYENIWIRKIDNVRAGVEVE